MRIKNKYLNQEKLKAQDSASIYFNLSMVYRDAINTHNGKMGGGEQESTIVLNGEHGPKKPIGFVVDDILNEIAEKGIESISEEKLNFLKSIQNNQNGDKV